METREGRGHERKGRQKSLKGEAGYTRNADSAVRKGAKQSNVHGINVNTAIFFPLLGHVSAAGERCLDCVVVEETDSGAVEWRERSVCYLLVFLYCQLWKLRKVLVFGVQLRCKCGR